MEILDCLEYWSGLWGPLLTAAVAGFGVWVAYRALRGQIKTSEKTLQVLKEQVQASNNQTQFQTYLKLEDEWNSEEMLKYRKEAEKMMSDETQLPRLENILEFFEKFALFKTRNALDIDFILRSVLGFYEVRYYYYNKENIGILRNKFSEPLLYEELEKLYYDYVKFDEKTSSRTPEEFEEVLNCTDYDSI
ncbi:MAG: hypothetical protein WBW56_05455 [Syntrophobacteraceae bacterium]